MLHRMKLWCLASTMIALLWGCGGGSPKVAPPAPDGGGQDAGDSGAPGDSASDTSFLFPETGADTGAPADATLDGHADGNPDAQEDVSPDGGEDTSADASADTSAADSSTGDAAPMTFTVGGSVSGLSGTLVLENNGGDDLTVTADGTFSFQTPLSAGASFDVTVSSQPAGETCTVMGGTGAITNGNVSSVVVSCVSTTADAGPTYVVGGTISGLAGALVLQDNGGDNLTLHSNGSFAFATPLANGATYSVMIIGQPTMPVQTCTIAGGTGTVSGANVTSVSITCSTASFAVGGTLTGLGGGEAVVLQDNGGDNLTLTSNGAFAFATKVPSGGAYAVTVLTQPSSPAETCTVTMGTGSVLGGNVANVTVTCTTPTFTIGGTLIGLAGAGPIVLADNGTDDLSVTANGGFTFLNKVTSGGAYAVTIKTQPPGQTCSVSGGTGTVNGSAVTSVVVNCGTTFTVGGVVSGLASGDVLSLENNGTNEAFITSNGSFAFSTPLGTGATYSVTVTGNPTAPVSQTCTVTNGTGTVASANVTTVTVTCKTSGFTVSGTVTGLAAGDTLTLTDNGGNPLTLPAGSGPGAAPFTFSTALASGANYSVGIQANPTAPVSQTCTITGGVPSGKIGNANVTGIQITCVTVQIALEATISGVAAGDTVTLDDANGNFGPHVDGTFPLGTVPSGQAYAITVASQAGAISQTCTVTGGTGTAANTTPIVATVVCATDAFAFSVDVTGLANPGTNPFTLTNTDTGLCAGAGCVLDANGTAALGAAPSTEASGTAYDFTITAAHQPKAPGQTCTVTSPAGTVTNAPVTITVSCATNTTNVGGSVAAGSPDPLLGTITLHDSDATNSAATQTVPPAAKGASYGELWNVKAVPQTCSPATDSATVCMTTAGTANQTCVVQNPTGTAAGPGNVTNVNLSCTTSTFPVGGTVSALAAGDTFAIGYGAFGAWPVTLAQTLTVSANGAFQFPTPVASGFELSAGFTPLANHVISADGQHVRIASATAPEQCNLSSVSNGNTPPAGVSYVGNAAVTGETITCTPAFTVGGTLIGANAHPQLADTVTGYTAADTLTQGNGPFTFASPLGQGDVYAVTVTAAGGQQCSIVANGAGTMGTANVANVDVECGGAGSTCGTTNANCISDNCLTGVCQRGVNTLMCGGNADCLSNVCSAPFNGTCQGATHVALGGACGGNGDCVSNVCTAGVCRPPCGQTSGAAPPATGAGFCADGTVCAASGDCGSGLCAGGVCVASVSCGGGQTTCGPFGVCVTGACPAELALGATCVAADKGADCLTAVCSGADKCAASTCGAAGKCGTGAPCDANAECSSGTCAATHLCQ